MPSWTENSAGGGGLLSVSSTTEPVDTNVCTAGTYIGVMQH